MYRTIAAVVASLCSFPALWAQAPDPAAWRVPIHTHPADPAGGEYGLWAAGPDYKVSFDDGFTFYPVLGVSQPHNLPLRWRTERIAAGETILVDRDTAATAQHTDWRYELRYGEITEAYDVRADGVEQTFVLHSAPADGALVIEGRIETAMRAPRVAPAPQSLSFADTAGRVIVRYGQAMAYDAEGRRAPVCTSCDGGVLHLHVLPEWLADAAYPVTIDPLTSTVPIAVGGGAPSFPDMIRADLPNLTILTYSRATSATDWDLFAQVVHDDFAVAGMVFTDLAAAWSTRHATAAYLEGPDRWLIALGRDFQNTSQIRVYSHDAASFSLNSGLLAAITPPLGSHDHHPSIAGQSTWAADDRGYLVFQRDQGSIGTPFSRVIGMTVYADTATFGPPANLHTTGGLNYDAEYPSITQNSINGTSWVAVWQELDRDVQGDDWDVVAQRIANDGTLGGTVELGSAGNTARHKLRPVVGGALFRFMVAFTLRDNLGPAAAATGDEIAVQRFDWALNAPAPTTQPVQTAVTTPFNTLRGSETSRTISYGYGTLSHWGLVYSDTNDDIHALRCGYAGRVVEQTTVFADPVVAGTPAAICYNDDTWEFHIGYGTDQPPWQTIGTRFTYDPAAQATPYGPACGADIFPYNQSSRDEPFAGSEFYRLVMLNGARSAPTVLLASLAPGLLNLPGGCFLRLDPGSLVVVDSGTSSVAGHWRYYLSLLDSIKMADVFWQFVQLDPAGGMRATPGLHMAVR